MATVAELPISTRVRYVHRTGVLGTTYAGREGITTETPRTSFDADMHVKVVWDDGRTDPDFPFIENLDVIRVPGAPAANDDFPVGARVELTRAAGALRRGTTGVVVVNPHGDVDVVAVDIDDMTHGGRYGNGVFGFDEYGAAFGTAALRVVTPAAPRPLAVGDRVRATRHGSSGVEPGNLGTVTRVEPRYGDTLDIAVKFDDLAYGGRYGGGEYCYSTSSMYVDDGYGVESLELVDASAPSTEYETVPGPFTTGDLVSFTVTANFTGSSYTVGCKQFTGEQLHSLRSFVTLTDSTFTGFSEGTVTGSVKLTVTDAKVDRSRIYFSGTDVTITPSELDEFATDIVVKRPKVAEPDVAVTFTAQELRNLYYIVGCTSGNAGEELYNKLGTAGGSTGTPSIRRATGAGAMRIDKV